MLGSPFAQNRFTQVKLSFASIQRKQFEKNRSNIMYNVFSQIYCIHLSMWGFLVGNRMVSQAVASCKHSHPSG